MISEKNMIKHLIFGKQIKLKKRNQINRKSIIKIIKKEYLVTSFITKTGKRMKINLTLLQGGKK